MGTGDYICVTLRGEAPWGFTLRQGEGDTYSTYRPFLVSQVEEGGHAFSAGVQEGDEVVSINGEPCADLTLLRALALVDTSIGCLQLLLKRYCSIPSEDYVSEETYCGEKESFADTLASTTLHILSPKHRSQSPRELYISEPQEDAYYATLDSGGESPKGPHGFCTQIRAPSSSDDHRCQEADFKETEAQRCFSPGNMVELQVSLPEQKLDDVCCASLGSARGIEGQFSIKEADEPLHTSTASHRVREPLGQHGVVLGSPSVPKQVKVILQQPTASSGAGRSILSVGGHEVSGSTRSQSEGKREGGGGGEEGGGGHYEGVPGCFTVTFEVPSEDITPAEEQDSDSEGDQDKPNKHRARHSRLRRSESLSEKQVKEAKSKCKRIALLLTAAPPNPNNKGVLMFKKHRQRAKKYTLVSYGTGEDEQQNSNEEGEEDEDDKQETHTVAFTLVAPKDPGIDEHFLANASCSKGVLTINWDKGLLEIEKNLKNKEEMECLPDTKGKGALMFVQRRQRMDEIAAEHEELRRQGIPVEGVPKIEEKTMERSYMQSATEGHAYMDVNMHQQSQQQQQYQQYQEQQYYEQQQSYQQQQQSYHQQQQSFHQQQQYEQQYQQQQQQYEQQQYQQQMYQQQQGYHHEQEHYSTNVNGTVQHQTNEMQATFSNRTAKPFSVENMAATPYSPTLGGTNQESVGQGEQIASRDERISTPAIKTGLLQDTKRRAAKPMFTFKDAPKVSPSPVLLNLLNRNGKKLGFESGPEEDYLSLGAEACNFLQSPKQKIPPPVAPKPVINPNSLLWSPQIEINNQDTAQHAENSVSTPAAAPTTDIAPAPDLEPTPAPAPEPSPPPATMEVPASVATEDPQTRTPPEPESEQQPAQVKAQEENCRVNSAVQPEPVVKTSWAGMESQTQQPPPTSQYPGNVVPQEPPASQSSPQSSPPWATRQASQPEAQPPPVTTTWTPQSQPSWSQPQEQSHVPHNQTPWVQPVEQSQSHLQMQPPRSQPVEQPHPQSQVQPPWAASHEQPHVQPMQQTWDRPQDAVQHQAQVPWAQPLGPESPHQPPWVRQPQQNAQVQPPWVREAQPECQTQPPWVQQPQQQVPQQAWSEPKAPEPQPPWVSAQPQHPQQPSVNAWNPSQAQAQAQPPWMQAAQSQPLVQTSVNPWAPVPAQAQPHPSWAQQPPEHGQHAMHSWAQEQNQATNQPSWAQPASPKSIPQPPWQMSTPKSPPQPSMNAVWPPAQAQPQPHVSAWVPEPQQTPVASLVNTSPSPKPWQPPQSSTQSRIAPPPPQRINSFTTGQRASSTVNPMATTLIPSSAGPAYEMPVVRGRGADMFAKRQSRMEKYIVDSETVQANKESRSASPAASLPNEWKYTPNVRAPPSRAFNPIQSPSYPPAAVKQPPPGAALSKDKKKAKDKQTPARKPLNVVDVMKHQPYQLNSSLFTYGPAEEAPKLPAPKPDPAVSIENQTISYEQMPPIQQSGQFNAPYPQQDYGMPMQPMMHEGHYQQNPADVYAPPNPYQQPAVALYQQAYNQHYQPPALPAYHPQSLHPAYPQGPQVACQPASSPPYLAAPSSAYQQQQPPSSFVAPVFTLAARPESASGANPGSAPKPKFTAKKSSAQAFGRSYSLSPPARILSRGQKSASASTSPKPPSRASTTPPAKQTPWLEKAQKPLSPWEAASRHPLGLVDEAFASQSLYQSLASNVCLAAQRRLLPEPPAEWMSKMSYQAPQKKGSHTWGYSQSHTQRRAPLPSFVCPTKTVVSTSAANRADYNSLPRPWQPQRSVTQDQRPMRKQTNTSVYTNNIWSHRR